MSAPGLIDGRFVVEAEVASGGMGRVYRGRDLTTGAQVAVKVLLRRGVTDHARFEREAEILASFDRDGVVRYVAHGALDDGAPYLAMAWVDGETLEARLGAVGVTIADSVVVARRVADVLAFVHERGIVHRDIKPSNLILQDRAIDRTMVIDFGIARAVDADSLTATGSIIGTPSYNAPEQIRGERDIGPAADVFALGCVLYECLTGGVAFVGTQLAALREKVLRWEPPRVRALAPEVPNDLDELVTRMLAKHAADRPRDGAALVAELAALPVISATAAAPRRRSVEPPTHVTRVERPAARVVEAAAAPPAAGASPAAAPPAAAPPAAAPPVRAEPAPGARGMDGPSRRDAAALIGRSFGEFVVRELISSGGFGMVFRAEQPALAREAVIKVLHTRHRASETLAQRFLREAQLASKLDHPYAAHIYAFGAEPDGVLWIAMELVRGTPLDRLLEAQGPVPLERFVPLCDRLAEVIQTAHDQGIVHRDLKPGNVMVLRRAGRLLPKLLDLGIAKFGGALPGDAPSAPDPSLAATVPEDSDVAAAPVAVRRLTEHGAMMGSPLYMAPEQWVDAGTADGRTDQYALAVLCFEALTGRPPFTGTSKMQIARAHARQAPPPLDHNLPPALDPVLARALAKQPADRYPTVLEFAAAVRAASGIAAEPIALPRLPEPQREAVLARAPQPLAQAIAALDAARNAHQARDAVWQVVRVAVRLCGVTALAAHAHVGAGASTSPSAIGDALRGLRRRALSDADWLEVARELCRPFAGMKDAHPLPELVAMVCDDARAITALLALRAASEDHGGNSDAQVRALLDTALPLCGALLDELAFFSDYPLVIPFGGGLADVWMGVRKSDRPTLAVRGGALADGQPALVDAAGVPAVALWPYVQLLSPAPGAADALFFFEGQGRRGARLVALPDAFERDDEALWAAFGGIFGDLPDAVDAATSEDKERCPFPGLAAFTRDDAAAFFGRERETEAFVNRLRAQPLGAVVGPSGAGKSSFVQAGVLPALPTGWRAITVRPGAAPLAALAARLAAAGIEVGELRAVLADHPGALGALLRAGAQARHETVVLVIDQLEELFTLCEDADERALYAEALVRAARTAEDPVRIVVTLRDDFLLDAEALPALRSRLGQGLQLLTTPAEADLRRILIEPVARAGYEFDDPGLPDEMVAAIAHAPGALALLSFTAARLWELRDRRFRQLHRKAYASLGGVGGALAAHAEATLEAMPQDQRGLVREVFRHLVTAEGTRAVLSRDELDQVLGGGPHAGAVVEKLVAARLLVTSEREGGGERVEVIHEALLDAWPRLVGWRREDALGARLRDQLRAAARQWDERGRASGLLWRGDALAEYRLWRARTAAAVTATEEAFATASLADAARGRRTRAVLLGGAFLVLAAGLIALLILNARANGERARAEASQHDTEAAAAATRSANAQLNDNLVQQYENQGRRLVLDGDPLQALAYLAKAGALGARGRAHDFLIAAAVRATDGELRAVRHDGWVNTVRFSADGARFVTASFDHQARIWDARTGALVRSLAHDDVVIAAAFSPDDRTVVTNSFDGTAALWDAETGARLHTFAHKGSVRCAVFSPDGSRVLTASTDDTVKIWATGSGALQLTVHGDGAGQSPCAFSADGARIAAGDERGTARIWDARSGQPLAVLHHHRDRVRAVRFSPDGAQLVTTSRDGTAAIWAVASGRLLHVLAHQAAVISVDFSPDGRRIATASNDRTAAVWDAATGDRLLTLAGHAAGVNRAIFSPDGGRIVTVSDDGTARLWDAASGRALARWLGHRDAVVDVAFDATGQQVATAGYDGSAILWSAVPQDPILWLVGHSGAVAAASFAPDGGQIVTAGYDGTARIWDAATGAARLVLRGHQGIVGSAAFSPDGRAVATAGADGTIRVWDARSGASRHVLAGHSGAVNQVGWAPDGSKLVSAGDDGTLRTWDAVTGHALLVIKAHGSFAVDSATFDPAGTSIVTTGDDNTTRRWDAITGLALRTYPDQENPGTVTFDPAGKRAASPVRQSLRIWDVETGKTLVELVGHVGQVTRMAWSADDALIVTGGVDGTARVWDAASGDQLAVLPHGRQVFSVGFSPDATRIVSSAEDGTVAIREVPRYDGAPAALAALLRCRVPYEAQGDRIVSRQPDRCETSTAP
jgi:WD40 repeat protein/serine/threonine protein kinase